MVVVVTGSWPDQCSELAHFPSHPLPFSTSPLTLDRRVSAVVRASPENTVLLSLQRETTLRIFEYLA